MLCITICCTQLKPLSTCSQQLLHQHFTNEICATLWIVSDCYVHMQSILAWLPLFNEGSESRHIIIAAAAAAVFICFCCLCSVMAAWRRSSLVRATPSLAPPSAEPCYSPGTRHSVPRTCTTRHHQSSRPGNHVTALVLATQSHSPARHVTTSHHVQVTMLQPWYSPLSHIELVHVTCHQLHITFSWSILHMTSYISHALTFI